MKQQAVRLGALLWLAGSLALVGCRSFAPASSATQRLVRAMELSERIPADQFLLEIESPALSGIFVVLFVAEQQGMRAQLFPDVGGKVMDLTVGAGAITATIPGQSYRAILPYQQSRPHFALVLAAMLGELMEPVTATRVIGERVNRDGQIEVQLLPALGAGEVIAGLDSAGRIHCYRIRLGAIAFTLDADGFFAGRGFSGRLCP